MAGRGERGFTLIEVLVGLTLLGALVAVLTGALRLGLQGRETVDGRAEWLDEVRVSQTFVRQYIEAARPFSWVRDRRTEVAFEGLRESVSFVAAMPGWQNPGGLYLVRIAREGDRLMMTRRITSGETDGFDFAQDAERTILATGIARLDFSYFGGAKPFDETPRWHDQWQGQAATPRLVRLDLTYRHGNRWPVLVAAPMIGPQPR